MGEETNIATNEETQKEKPEIQSLPTQQKLPSLPDDLFNPIVVEDLGKLIEESIKKEEKKELKIPEEDSRNLIFLETYLKSFGIEYWEKYDGEMIDILGLGAKEKVDKAINGFERGDFQRTYGLPDYNFKIVSRGSENRMLIAYNNIFIRLRFYST
ncbi:MAG: hypothetical protein QXL86_01695 [Candidatus Aenigmatarchaeota archaeon]